MPAPKQIPEKLQKLLKVRPIDTRTAQKFLDEHGMKVSLGWLSMHKNQWQTKEKLKFEFDEDDTSYDTDLASRIRLLKGEDVVRLSEKKHFTKSQLKRLCKRTAEACAEFAKECLVWYGKPVMLQDYQLDMIRGWLGKKNSVYPIGRGGGKDFTLAVFLIWYCTIFPNTRVIVVCPAYRQVRTFMNENMAIMMQTSNVLYDSITRFTDEEFFLTNGSQVFTYGATSFIKGKHNIQFIFANEAAEIPDHVYFNVLMPMLGSGTKKGHLGILGVPSGQVGYFWEAFVDSSKNPSDRKSMFYLIHLPTRVNKYYSKEQLEANKQMMSTDTFLQEHEAKFLDVEDALFSSAIIEKMKEEYDLFYGIVDHKRFNYYLGIDWGRTGSYTVYSILEEDKKTKDCRLIYIKGVKKPFPEQIAWVLRTDDIYNFNIIMTEKMGLGIPPSETLRKKLGSRKVKFFIPTPTSWFNAFTKLRDAAENEKIKIPAGQLKLVRQLRLMGFKMRGEKLTVRSEGKDDYAQSFCMAFWGVKKRSQAGVAGRL